LLRFFLSPGHTKNVEDPAGNFPVYEEADGANFISVEG